MNYLKEYFSKEKGTVAFLILYCLILGYQVSRFYMHMSSISSPDPKALADDDQMMALVIMGVGLFVSLLTTFSSKTEWKFKFTNLGLFVVLTFIFYFMIGGFK